MSSRPRCCPSSSNVARADSSHCRDASGRSRERFEHRLRVVHVGLDQWRPRRDPEDPDQVEAAPTRSLHGRRTPELGKGSKGQHSVAEAAIADPPSRCQRSVERTLARADLAERHKGVGEHELCVREPRVVIVGAQHPCRSPRAVGDRAERFGGSQRRQPRVEHVGDRRFVLGRRRRNEVGDNERGFIGVATGDQRVAAFTREHTPARVFGGQEREDTTEQRRRGSPRRRGRAPGSPPPPGALPLDRPDHASCRCRPLRDRLGTGAPAPGAIPKLRRARSVPCPTLATSHCGIALVQIGAHLLKTLR